MEKTDNTPLWVFLAFSSIQTRIGAARLIWASIAFTVYCFPWPLYLPTQELMINKILIEDWSWFAMMLPIIVWYWVSLKWMDTTIWHGILMSPLKTI
ncbi:MAG: hypothetical protein QM484_01450 [Woeseiaceae bacterium]